MRKNKIGLLLSLCLLGLSSVAAAAEQASVLVCYTAGPIDTTQAQGAMGSIMKVVERLGGLPADSFTTKFVANMADCYKALADKPHYLFPSSELYLSKQAEFGFDPLVKPFIADLPNDTYYIMVKKGSFKNIDDLKGKSLGGAVLGEPLFLQRVVFENKFDPQSYFTLVDTPRPKKALKEIAQGKGKVDAVMVNAQQYNAMKQLPFFSELEIAYTSPKIAQLGLVASKYANKDTAAKVKTALEKLCSDEEGKGLCNVFGVQQFVSTSRSDYQDMEQRYGAAK